MNLSIIPTVKSVVTDGNEVSFFDFAPAMSLQAHCRTEDILSDFAFELKGNKLIKAEIDESLEKEEYSVAVSENEIVIKGSCDAGVHYGFCTLVQLAALNDGAIPTGVINDKPDMSFRAVSDDISRGQISTVDGFKSMIRRFSYFKYNTSKKFLKTK